MHNKPVQCDQCQKFIAPKNLEKHKRTHQKNQFCCSQCGKFKSSAERLKYQEKVCGQERRNKGHISCPHCQKTYANEYSLSRHVTRDHSVITSDGSLTIKQGPNLSTSVSQAIDCVLCRKTFRKRQFLNKHMKKVHLAEEETFDTVSVRRVRKGRKYVILEKLKFKSS